MTRTTATLSFRAKPGISLPFFFPSLLFFFFSLLFAALPGSAQVQTGTPPFGSFVGGPDTINLGNLNVHLTIPVLHRPGRGTNFNYDLTFDSSVWYPVGVSGSQSWQNVPNWGWTSNNAFASGNEGYLVYTQTTTYCYDGQGHPNGADQYISNSIYYDPWGTPHHFTGYVDAKYGGCGNSSVNTYPGTTGDGSGLILNSPTGPIITTGGASITPPSNPSTGTYASSVTDRNGNQMNADTNGNFFDTLSSTTPVLTVSGSVPNPISFAYTAPSGASAQYKMKFASYSIQTNFGCNGIVEYGTNGTTTANLVSEIDLPDGSKYTFFYEATRGHSGFVTGRLASVQLSTGGTISYAYSGSNNGIICADGSTATLTRTTPDGTWIYAHSESGTAWTTLITDPQGNQTNMNFQGIYETQRQVYSGLQSGGNLLRQWTTCYNGNTSNCNATAVTLPITQRNVTDQYGSSGLQCQHNYFYNSVGGLSEQDDYDYGSGAHGALLRKLLVTYASLGNITAFRQTVTICNGTGSNSSCAGPSGGSVGSVVSKTNYNYDETGVPTPTNQPTPQHTSVSGSRGNLTSINYPVSGLTSHFTYYDTGEPNVATDVNGGTTTYTYGPLSATCGNAFPTGITEPYGFSRSFAWNCAGGVMTSLTDANGNATSSAYSDAAFWRPASISFPDGGKTSWAYSSATSLTTTTKMNSSQNLVSTTLLDGLGRTKQTQLTDPEGVDYQDTKYDALGRVASVSNPYRSTSDPTYGLTSYQYDALSRPTLVIPPDGSSSADNISASYSNNTTTVIDQAGKTRQSTIDALGRLTQVIEDPGASPHLNYVTSYAFDALGNLTNVMQNGGRQRTFVYDAMSRLTSETNPESGTVTYGYNSNGDLITRTAPAPNQTGSATVITCFGTLNGTSCDGSGYDLLHRPTKKSYSDGTTPSAFFSWDGTGRWGVTQTNTTGRLGEEWTGTPCCASGGAEIFSYDAMGRTVYNNQYTVPMGNMALNYSYDLVGDTLTASNGVGVTFTQSFDTAGRPMGLTSSLVDANHPATLATVDSSVGYYPAGALRKMTYGNGLTQSNVYNNLLQPCLLDVNNNSTTLQTCNDSTPGGNVLDFWMGYNAGSSDNGNVVNWNATGAQSFVRTFGYDSLNRVSQMQETTGAAEGCKPSSSSSNPYTLTWGYDAWGNRTSQSPSSGTCSFSQSANTLNQLSGSPYQYDAAGNMIADGNHTYFYDAENRLVQVDGTFGTCSTATACYLYDALGHRTVKQTGSYYLSYLHDLSGNPVTENCNPCSWGTGWNRGHIYFGGQQIAEYFNGTTYFIHPDHLGSTRLLTGVNQSVVQSADYLPFGELLPSNSWYTDHFFTGDERDTETNLDHTQFRQYSSQLGRWMHPDPAGLAAVDPSNPQSWNRYSYVLNNPLSNIDPTGLYCVYLTDAADGVESIDDNSSSGECGESGGYWIAGEYGGGSQISINSDLGLVSGYGYLDGSWQYSVAGAMDSNPWGAWTQTVGGSSSDPSYAGDTFAISTGAMQYGAYQGERLTKALIPTTCGGGVFVYAGSAGKYKGAEGFVGYLGEYDTKTGWSNNMLLEGGGENLSGGVSANTHHFEPLVFVPVFKYGGLVLGTGGVGFYVGTPRVGGGGYVNGTSMLSCEGR